MVITINGIIVKANFHATMMFKQEDLIGMTFVDLIHPDNQNNLEYRINNYIADLKSGRTYKAVAGDGSVFYLEGRSKVIYWEGRKAMMLIGQKIDRPVQVPIAFTG